MKSQDESMRTLEAVLKLASQGVDAAEVSLSGGTLGITRFADNEVHQAGELNETMLAIRVVNEGRSARVETSDLTLEGVQSAARQARMMAQYMPEPSEPVELPGPQKYEATEASDELTEHVRPLDRMAVIGRIILSAQKRGLYASGYVSTRHGSIDPNMHGAEPYAIANTRGVAVYHPQTHAAVSLTMQRGDVSGWAEVESHSAGRIDIDRVVQVATSKLERQKRLRSVGPGRYTVILEPAAVASLLEFVACTCGAEDIDQGRSFLAGRLGEKIVSDAVSIRDDYSHPLLRGTPFDSEGVARRRVDIIDKGVAKGPVYGYASARRHSVEPTGHMSSSRVLGDGERASYLVMDGGRQSVDGLLDQTHSGILVTRLWYTRLHDPRNLTMTGVTRDGTFLIEGGRIKTGLSNLRFNVSLLDVLKNIDGMSRPVRAGGMVVPAMRVHNFSFTSSVDN